MAIIQIEHVSKTFQTKDGTIDALKDVSLNIEAGDIYGSECPVQGKVLWYDVSII